MPRPLALSIYRERYSLTPIRYDHEIGPKLSIEIFEQLLARFSLIFDIQPFGYNQYNKNSNCLRILPISERSRVKKAIVSV